MSRSKNIALVDLKLCQNKLDKIRELIQLATITSIGCHYCDFHVGMTSTDMKILIFLSVADYQQKNYKIDRIKGGFFCVRYVPTKENWSFFVGVNSTHKKIGYFSVSVNSTHKKIGYFSVGVYISSLGFFS